MDVEQPDDDLPTVDDTDDDSGGSFGILALLALAGFGIGRRRA